MTEIFLLDRAWKFHKGIFEEKTNRTHTQSYMAAKAGGAPGAANGGFDRSDWETVNLPHDWSVASGFSEKWGCAQGYKERGAGWYSKDFRLDEADADKDLLLVFDGVSSHCDVYLNGSLVGRNFCGYTSFAVDITDLAFFGDRINNLSVFVDATVDEGWWYEGSGIYRHVRLLKKSRTAIAHQGVFVHPEYKGDTRWETRVDTEVYNHTEAEQSMTLSLRIYNADGAELGAVSDAVWVPPYETLSLHQTVPVTNPAIWDIETPNLCTAVSELSCGGVMVDRRETRFGFRTIAVDKDKGFFLNGRHLLLYGTANHQDHAGVGVAVPDAIQVYRIQKLKEMGCNAYRCAHGNPAPEILDACDRYGMLVMDENRNFNTSEEGLAQVRAMVKRDRNHPCVVMYSLFNEEQPFQGTETGGRLASHLCREVKRMDATRFVVGAMDSGFMESQGAVRALDIVGFNYRTHMLDAFRKQFPDKPMLGSENNSAFHTRGVYQTDHEAHVIDNYDSESAPWGNTHRDGLKQILTRPYMLGLFVWTGFDYRGEPTPFQWPSIGTQFGVLDTCGFPKDAFYLLQAFFTEAPMIHLLPHWNFAEGDSVRVMAYTNCEEAELFLNGESRGRKSVEQFEMAEWQVDFAPGRLELLGYRGGEIVCRDAASTAGKPSALVMTVSKERLLADCDDAVAVNIAMTDGQGVFVPEADHLIRFRCEGGEIFGVGNGDPNSHEADKASERKLFHGRCQAIIRALDGVEAVRIRAETDGIAAAELTLPVLANAGKPTYIKAVEELLSIQQWRTNAALFAEKPMPDIAIADHDMNSWPVVRPAVDEKFAQKTGYGIYKARFDMPKDGRYLLFRQVYGSEVEIYLNGVLRAHGEAKCGKEFRIENLPQGDVELAVIIESAHALDRGGIAKSVVILS